MNKADLTDLLASTHSLSKAEAGRILETLLSTIVKTVKKGGSVGIAGFGAFKMEARSARGGYNPGTRSKMKIPAVKVPKFTPGTAFRAEVDPRAAARKAAASCSAGMSAPLLAGTTCATSNSRPGTPCTLQAAARTSGRSCSKDSIAASSMR